MLLRVVLSGLIALHAVPAVAQETSIEAADKSMVGLWESPDNTVGGKPFSMRFDRDMTVAISRNTNAKWLILDTSHIKLTFPSGHSEVCEFFQADNYMNMMVSQCVPTFRDLTGKVDMVRR